MTYFEFIKNNYGKMRANESLMWASIEEVSELLEEMREADPAKFWAFMRKAHEQMLGAHFDETYARWQVERMHHTSPNGSVHRGEHWTIDQVMAATNKYRAKFPAEVTEWDVYVALNSQWHDYDDWAATKFDSPEQRDTAIIDGAIAFWFADEDYPSPTKVWDYFAKLVK